VLLVRSLSSQGYYVLFSTLTFVIDCFSLSLCSPSLYSTASSHTHRIQRIICRSQEDGLNINDTMGVRQGTDVTIPCSRSLRAGHSLYR
jgi:hypothetical protein